MKSTSMGKRALTTYASLLLSFLLLLNESAFAERVLSINFHPDFWHGGWLISSPTLAKSTPITIAGNESQFSYDIGGVPAGSRIEFTWQAGNRPEDSIRFEIIDPTTNGQKKLLASRNGGISYTERINLPAGDMNFYFTFIKKTSNGGYQEGTLSNVRVIAPDVADTTAPSLTFLNGAPPSPNQVRIDGTTNEAAISSIIYQYCGASTLSQTPYTTNYATSFIHQISSLISGQDICFAVALKDQANNLRVQQPFGIQTLPKLSVLAAYSIGTYSVSWNYPSTGWSLQMANSSSGPWSTVNLAALPQGDYEQKGAIPYRYFYASFRVSPGVLRYFRLVNNGSVVSPSSMATSAAATTTINSGAAQIAAPGSSANGSSLIGEIRRIPLPINLKSRLKWNETRDEVSLNSVEELLQQKIRNTNAANRFLPSGSSLETSQMDQLKSDLISEIATEDPVVAENAAPLILFSEKLRANFKNNTITRIDYTPELGAAVQSTR